MVGGRVLRIEFAHTDTAFSSKTRALISSGPKSTLRLGLDQLGHPVEKEKLGKSSFEHNSNMSVSRKAGPRMMQALGAIIH